MPSVLTALISRQQIGDHGAAHGVHKRLENAQPNSHVYLPALQGEALHQAAGAVAQQGNQCQPQNRRIGALSVKGVMGHRSSTNLASYHIQLTLRSDQIKRTPPEPATAGTRMPTVSYSVNCFTVQWNFILINL